MLRSCGPMRFTMVFPFPSSRRASPGPLLAGLAAALAVGVLCTPAAAGRPRRPSGAQIKKMQAQMEYAQKEMMRYRNEMAVKEKEMLSTYDENGNGKLEGTEKAKYNKYLGEVKSGKVPNPFSGILPPGQGPKTK